MLTPLRAILRGAARSLGVERAANAALIEEMWADVVGPDAAGHSRVRGVRGTTVLAEAEAGPWAQELSARRGRFITEINRRLGSEVVTEIRFRQTTVPFPAQRGVKGQVPVGKDAGGHDAGGRDAGGHDAGGSDAGRHEARGHDAWRPTAGEDEPLSSEDLATVERTVSEIQDPEIREGARRAMMSQLRWRRRQGVDAGGAAGERS